jgi:uncharacterized protein (DUF2249 family)
MTRNIVRLDVREDLQQGREPFGKIMGVVARLKPQEELILMVPFEPVPLYGILAQQGYQHRATRLKSGDWEIFFSRSKTQAAQPAPEAAAPRTSRPRTVVDLDARGLEPPQPLVRILEAVQTLPADTELRARTDRRPIHLYPHLEERGFVARGKEEPDGSFITIIRRR